jgi:hypothetical protein
VVSVIVGSGSSLASSWQRSASNTSLMLLVAMPAVPHLEDILLPGTTIQVLTSLIALYPVLVSYQVPDARLGRIEPDRLFAQLAAANA